MSLDRQPARPGVAAVLFLALLAVPGTVEGQRDTAAATADLPPAGYGTLRQEDVALRIQTSTLAIRILPLDERILRLLAPDAYDSLHRLLLSKREEIGAIGARYGTSTPTPFLVTFFGRQDRARFEPEILTLTSQNRFFRPLEIVPLTSLWSLRQLDQRETASAVYVFEELRLLDPFIVSYEGVAGGGWEQTLRTLDRERASVLARASGKTP